MDNEEGNEDESLFSRFSIILLVLVTAAVLLVATGEVVPFFDQVIIPPYILLYALLGSLAYLLSSSIGECEKLMSTTEYKEVSRELAENEALRDEARKSGREPIDATLDSITAEIVDLRRRKSVLVTAWKKAELKLLVKIARIPFGVVVAAAFYLLVPLFISNDLIDTENPRLLAGIAFVVALFPKVIINGLNGLASRLIGSYVTRGQGEPE
ncbi:MAG: hypothetical protein HXS43_02950 [Theionarchaea archaeon]|nr:hypothetical protein [Theionarchaea archaeon]